MSKKKKKKKQTKSRLDALGIAHRRDARSHGDLLKDVYIDDTLAAGAGFDPVAWRAWATARMQDPAFLMIHPPILRDRRGHRGPAGERYVLFGFDGAPFDG